MLKASQAKHEGQPIWRIWEVKVDGRTFEIDGQNHEHDSREWQVFELVETPGIPGLSGPGIEREWCDTVATKRDGLALVQELIERG